MVKVCMLANKVLPRNCFVPPGRSTAILWKKEITHLCQLPILASAYNGACIWVRRLIAEAWDCDGLNQVGAFPHYGGQWAEWNGHFRDTIRQFVKV